MSPKLPVVSGAKAIKAFRRLGYEITRQKGSHVRLRHLADPWRLPLSVPDHGTLKLGVLTRLLRDAGLTGDEFMALLRH